MSEKIKLCIRDTVITVLTLVIFFFVSLMIDAVFDAKGLISPLFVLAVFLISIFTNHYIYGMIAALVSVLAVNFAFSFPYFEFDFEIHENIISAIILIFVTTATNTLTRKIRSQEKVRLRAEKEKMRADLLRAISHDLRTPLTAIYGATSTVIGNYDALSDDKIIDILDGIQTDSEWLIRMVENLLSITRIDNSSLELLKSSVVLEELIDSVLTKFKKRYPKAVIELNMPDDFIVVSADPILIEQVIINLLENAIQHARGMTKLQFNISALESKVLFEVIDDGCGIEKEKLKNIFSGNYTTDNFMQNSQKKCMGIGLSVCAAIIKAHNGEIKAENLKKGGMRFSFTLMHEGINDE